MTAIPKQELMPLWQCFNDSPFILKLDDAQSFYQLRSREPQLVALEESLGDENLGFKILTLTTNEETIAGVSILHVINQMLAPPQNIYASIWLI